MYWSLHGLAEGAGWLRRSAHGQRILPGSMIRSTRALQAIRLHTERSDSGEAIRVFRPEAAGQVESTIRAGSGFLNFIPTLKWRTD